MDDQVGGKGIQAAVRIQDETAIPVLGTIEPPVQVVDLIPGCPHHGIIYDRIRNLDPGGHILI